MGDFPSGNCILLFLKITFVNININMKCDYGCGQEGIHFFKNGKSCCNINSSSCPKMKERNAAPKIGKPSGKLGKTGGIPWNKGLSKETDSRIAQTASTIKQKYKDGLLKGSHKGKHLDPEHRAKISERMMGNTNAHHRGDRQSFYKDIRMDSKWEVGTANYLDSIGFSWKYGATGFKLSSGNYYYPDFFIYKDNCLEKIIEVKGYFRQANKEKFNLFLLEYPNIKTELWDKNVLIKLGIINKGGKVVI